VALARAEINVQLRARGKLVGDYQEALLSKITVTPAIGHCNKRL
jgi:hypothetical protein